MDTFEIALRLAVAAAFGAALGLNRDLRGKPTGVRTLGLVGIGSAVAVLGVAHLGGDEVSRVIQGIVTGIGFLGAGVIIRNSLGKEVHGLTTAACVWLTACVGAACGTSQWSVILLSMPIVFIILAFGGPFERWVRRHWPDSNEDSGNG